MNTKKTPADHGAKKELKNGNYALVLCDVPARTDGARFAVGAWIGIAQLELWDRGVPHQVALGICPDRVRELSLIVPSKFADIADDIVNQTHAAVGHVLEAVASGRTGVVVDTKPDNKSTGEAASGQGSSAQEQQK